MKLSPILGEMKGLGMIVPWLGGKRQLLPVILPLLPAHKTYVELFGGGAAVLLSKKPAEKSVYNDIDPNIAGFYRKFSCKALEPCKKIRNVCDFTEKARDRVIKGSSDVCDQIAARRFTIVSGVTSGIKYDECDIRPIVTKTLERRCVEFEKKLRDTKIENLDFRKAFHKYDAPGTLTFADPPYVGSARVYRVKEESVTPEEVCGLARKARGKMLITFNDVPRVRKACAGLSMRSVRTKHRAAYVTRSKANRRELLIANFKI